MHSPVGNSDIEFPNDLFRWTIVTHSPESLWPERLLVAEQPIDCLRIQVERVVVTLYGVDVESRATAPVDDRWGSTGAQKRSALRSMRVLLSEKL